MLKSSASPVATSLPPNPIPWSPHKPWASIPHALSHSCYQSLIFYYRSAFGSSGAQVGEVVALSLFVCRQHAYVPEATAIFRVATVATVNYGAPFWNRRMWPREGAICSSQHLQACRLASWVGYACLHCTDACCLLSLPLGLLLANLLLGCCIGGGWSLGEGITWVLHLTDVKTFSHNGAASITITGRGLPVIC